MPVQKCKKNIFFGILKINEERSPELDPYPLIRGTDPGIRIRIRTKMSRIPNTGLNPRFGSEENVNLNYHFLLWL
jgi:hypothetical protein